MAFSVGNRVRVADDSSGYRNMKGTVKVVGSGVYDVRLDGHACASQLRFSAAQLQADATAEILDYSYCPG